MWWTLEESVGYPVGRTEWVILGVDRLWIGPVERMLVGVGRNDLRGCLVH